MIAAPFFEALAQLDLESDLKSSNVSPQIRKNTIAREEENEKKKLLWFSIFTKSCQ